MRPETRYARSGDVSIAYQVVGDGPLDLVLVSSWVTNVEENWEEPSYARFLTRLSSFARLIVFDKRGTGLSDQVAALPTLEERMDDIRAVMEATGSDRAALLGSTEGGAICALFGATYPARTSALIMYGSYAKRLRADDYPWGPTAEERESFYDLLTRQWGGAAILEYAAPSKLDDERFCRWWAGYLRRSASPGAALALTKMNSEIDIRPVLGAIRVPTLVLHRTGDRLCPIGGARFVASRIPGARLVELPGNDHLPFVGDVDAVVDAVQEFLIGARSTEPADRMLATVLLTEIVDATGMAATLGKLQWDERLGAYQALVRQELVRWRGSEIRTAGVGFLATFDGPARAIRCAVAIGEAARAVGIEVRSGLHAGEVDVLAGDIDGPAIDIAGRILNRASAGDVLVSSTVNELVIGSGIAFQEIAIRLMAPPGEGWRLFRVGHGPVVPERLPSALADDATADHSAARLSHREREVAAQLARGLANRQIADELVISVATVERHVANIFNKLGFRSRSQVAAWVVAQGLLRPGVD